MWRSHRGPLSLVTLCASIAIAASSGGAQEAPPRLEIAHPEPRAQSFHAIGRDPAGPRELVLWRWQGGRFTRVATARSDDDGAFDFGTQPLPLREGSYHVAPLGVEPDRDRPLHLARRLPGPVVLSSGLDPLELHLAPALFEGEIRLSEAHTGRLLLRRQVDSRSGARLLIDLRREGLAQLRGALEIEQVLPDGRRSEPTIWRLD